MDFATLASVLSLGLGLGLARTPYLGVACHQANSTTCGRVGIAVWLRGTPTEVEATVRHAGVRLRRERWANGETPWIGYVHLPLHAMGLPTGWTGPAKRLLLHLRVRRGGVWRTGTVPVLLGPGWG
jgi:hypothetical protein